VNYIAGHVGESIPTAIVEIGEPFVIHAEKVEAWWREDRER
jgi:hypothetical protein